jgi:septal ring factor EnvC (AmiA/AmiB activator)
VFLLLVNNPQYFHQTAIMENLSDQPDFGLLNEILLTAAGEIQKMQNIPALAQGNQILSAIQQLSGQMSQQTQSLQAQMQNFETKLNNFETKLNNFETKLDRLETKLDL